MKTSGSSRARLLAAALAGAMGCASAPAGGVPDADAAAPAAAAPAAAPAASDSAGPPVVQVRDYAGAPYVVVLAWSPAATSFGLRGAVNHDGTFVGGRTFGDHSLYVSATHVNDLGGFTRASIVPVPPGPVLLAGGPATDRQACNRGDVCTPSSYHSIQMPDSLLRQRRDSLVVTFTGGRYMPWRIVLERPLVDAFLRAVDSVVAARQGP